MTAVLLVRFLLRLVAIVLVVVSTLPFLHTNLWWVRICDFPRLQVAGLALLLGAVFLRGRMERIDQMLAGLLAVVVAIQSWFVFPFTPLARKTVPDAADPVPERTLRVVAANVLMENRDATALLAILREREPDIILLSEPDAWWIEQCRPLEASHRFTVLQPQSNHYGMALYSRFELVAPEVLFRVEPGVPSIRAGVRLPSGALVELYAVHPRPPGTDPPGADERQSSAPRDAELILVARELEERGVPALVVGDYNDVAWSHTTRLVRACPASSCAASCAADWASWVRRARLAGSTLDAGETTTEEKGGIAASWRANRAKVGEAHPILSILSKTHSAWTE